MNEDDRDPSPRALDWLLGTLPPPEAERFAEHLKTCSSCCGEVDRLRVVADALADAAPQAIPPAELRRRILAVVEDEAALSRAADAVDDQAPSVRVRWRPSRRLLAAASVALLAVGVLIGALLSGQHSQRSRPAVRIVAGAVTPAGGPAAHASVVIRDNTAELVLNRLAAPPKGRVYQAWLVRPPARTIPTGSLFSVPRSGHTRIRLPALRNVKRIIVTTEPPRGSRTPTPPPIAVVPLAR